MRGPRKHCFWGASGRRASLVKLVLNKHIFDHAKILKNLRESGGMADAQVSDACGSNTVWVQIPSLAPKIRIRIARLLIEVFYFGRRNEKYYCRRYAKGLDKRKKRAFG